MTPIRVTKGPHKSSNPTFNDIPTKWSQHKSTNNATWKLLISGSYFQFLVMGL